MSRNQRIDDKQATLVSLFGTVDYDSKYDYRREREAKIHRGIEQLDHGEGIPENELDAYLSKLKSKLT